MKIRNRDRKIDVEKIFIDKFENKSVCTLIINGQAINLVIGSVYTSVIFDYIENYLQVLGDEKYVKL